MSPIPADLAERQLVAYGPAAVRALASAIEACQSGDPLAPVTVVVPSNLAGLSLRRVLARERGLLNVRFMVLARLAELLGAPSLAARGLSPLTRWPRFEATRALLRSDAGVFGPVAAHPSTRTALDAAFRELRDAPMERVRAAASKAGRPGDVARLYLRFLDATRDAYDGHDLAFAAAQAVRAGSPALADIGAVLVWLPAPLGQADAELVSALLTTGHGALIAGLTGEPGPDTAAHALAGPGASVVDSAPSDALTATHIAVAVDTEEEVRTVIRLAMAAATRDGVPLDRMAVFYPSSGDYARLLHEQLDSAGIPHNGPGAASLAESVPARAVLTLLSLLDGGLTRSGVFTWLSAAPILESEEGAHRGPVPSRRWEKLVREAGVVRGIDQWRSRLGMLRRLREAAAADADAEGEETRADSARRDVGYIDRLLTFIEELHRDLSIVPGPGKAALTHVLRLLDRYLGSDTRHEDWPAAEAKAFQRVREALQEAAASAGEESTFALDELPRALEWLLAAPGERLGPFGEGMFVGPLNTAAGMDFDRVFLVGMAEGQVPSPPRIDALLPDDERGPLGLEPAAAVAANDRRRYLAALACAPQRTLLFARADLRGGRALQPSRWLLESAGRLGGQPITGRTLMEEPPAAPWLTVLPSFQAAIASAQEPAMPQEQDMRLLQAGPRPIERNTLLTLPGFAVVANGLDASRARAVGGRPRALSRWEASIGPIEGHSGDGARPVSPTALEEMAKCPFSYFLRYQLGVRDIEDRADELRISPLVKGSLVHRILERFYIEAADADALPAPNETWGAEAHERLAAIAREECGVDEAHGLTGAPLLWQLEQRRILDALDRFLFEDDRQRAAGFTFAGAEFEFGANGEDAPSLVLPGGGAIRFRGRIDRIDRAADGRVRVYDYKTGRSEPYKAVTSPEPFDGGRHIQLPVYALALGAAEPGANVSAWYWFVEERSAVKGYTVDGERLASFAAVAGDLDATIAAGLFPANPGKTNDSRNNNCTYCPFDRVCLAKTTRLQRLKNRAEGTPGLDRYRLLAGLDALVEADPAEDDYGLA